MLAYCGLDCTKCPAYIATQANDDKMRAECAEFFNQKYKMGVKPENVNCDGCRSDRVLYFCTTCNVRKCVREKKLDSCTLCSDFICNKLEELMRMDKNLKKSVEALKRSIK
jgi:hypothetical protein